MSLLHFKETTVWRIVEKPCVISGKSSLGNVNALGELFPYNATFPQSVPCMHVDDMLRNPVWVTVQISCRRSCDGSPSCSSVFGMLDLGAVCLACLLVGGGLAWGLQGCCRARGGYQALPGYNRSSCNSRTGDIQSAPITQNRDRDPSYSECLQRREHVQRSNLAFVKPIRPLPVRPVHAALVIQTPLESEVSVTTSDQQLPPAPVPPLQRVGGNLSHTKEIDSIEAEIAALHVRKEVLVKRAMQIYPDFEVKTFPNLNSVEPSLRAECPVCLLNSPSPSEGPPTICSTCAPVVTPLSLEHNPCFYTTVSGSCTS